jgi:hypothetical protein
MKIIPKPGICKSCFEKQLRLAHASINKKKEPRVEEVKETTEVPKQGVTRDN